MFVRIGILFCAVSMLSFGSAFAQSASTPSLDQMTAQKEIEGGKVRPNTASLELLTQGEKLYTRRCAACHSVDKNRIGPMHRGVYGRKAGTVSGFRYSRALKALDVTWNEETLDEWLTNPTAFAPGTSMGFRLGKAEERKAVIAYLKSISAPVEQDTDPDLETESHTEKPKEN